MVKFRGIGWKEDQAVGGTTHVTFSLYTCVMCYCVISASAYTSARPSSLKQKRCFSHWSSHRVTPIRTLRTQPTLVAEQVTAHFVDPRVAACTRRTAEEASLPDSGSDRRKKIHLRPSDQFLSVCLWRHVIISCFFGVELA